MDKGGVDMDCPICGHTCQKGFVEIRGTGNTPIQLITQIATRAIWYPEEYQNKRIRRETVELTIDAQGFFCEECMKVYAEFDMR